MPSSRAAQRSHRPSAARSAALCTRDGRLTYGPGNACCHGHMGWGVQGARHTQHS